MHPYAALTPEVVLDALSALGLRPDGRLLALSSYENRVYQVWVEEDPPGVASSCVVAKFYRPDRWSEAQIDEEHAFAHERAEREIPVGPPQGAGAALGARIGSTDPQSLNVYRFSPARLTISPPGVRASSAKV